MTAAIAELERLALFSQASRGLVPEWAHRPMLPHEVRARVNFAEMDRVLRTGYGSTAAVLEDLKAILVASVAGAVKRARTPAALAAALTAWVTDPPPAVRAAAAAAAAALEQSLVDVAGQAAGQVRAEATAQGVMVPVVLAEKVPGLPVSTDSFSDDAATPAAAVVNRIQQAVLGASQRPADPETALAAAAGVKLDGPTDLARQAVNIAHGEGRSAQIKAIPADPGELYASELLDSRTCGPCKAVDGRSYRSLEEAERDYPNSGPYHACKGGSRCRGTIVVIWGTEAGPTVDNWGPRPAPLPPLPKKPPKAPKVAEPPPADVMDRSARDLRKVTDDELAEAVGRAFVVDHPNTDVLVAELDRREAAALKAAQQKDLWRTYQANKRARDAEARNSQINALIDDGMDPREAVAEITGVSVQKQLQTELRVRLEQEGVPGRNLDEMIRRRYADEIHRRYVEAEDATNGYMTNKEGTARGIDPLALFTGSEARARKWASDELKEWWDINGRITLEDYRFQLINGTARAPAAGMGDFLT